MPDSCVIFGTTLNFCHASGFLVNVNVLIIIFAEQLSVLRMKQYVFHSIHSLKLFLFITTMRFMADFLCSCSFKEYFSSIVDFILCRSACRYATYRLKFKTKQDLIRKIINSLKLIYFFPSVLVDPPLEMALLVMALLKYCRRVCLLLQFGLKDLLKKTSFLWQCTNVLQDGSCFLKF